MFLAAGKGIVNLSPVDRARLAGRCTMPGSSLLCGGGKMGAFLPGAESFPHLLPGFKGDEEVAPRVEVLPDCTVS
jgi:hypothetical protein